MLFALPLALFILVNYDIIGEIRTEILSIPRLPGFRGDEIRLDIRNNLRNLFVLLTEQTDGLPWNSTEYGLYYHISGIFIVIGIGFQIFDFVRDIIHKRFNMSSLWLLYFFSAITLSMTITGANVNKINCIHMVMLWFASVGIYQIMEYLKEEKWIIPVMYVMLFCNFAFFYFTSYSDEISANFEDGLKEAVLVATSLDKKTIILDGNINYAKFLFYSKYPPDKFVETVKYSNYPNKWLSVDRFDGVVCGIREEQLMEKDIVVIYKGNMEYDLRSEGFEILRFNNDFKVAYKSP